MADQPLHIAVDARELLDRPTGVGRYLRGILDAWAASDFPHRVTLIGPTEAPPDLPSFDGRLTWLTAAGGPRARPAGTWWEQTTLARAVSTIDADVLFAAGYTAPLRVRCPTVVAVYDVSFFAHPEWFQPREGWRRRRVTRAAARRAHSVVTISAFSAGEIARYLGIQAARIHVAPPGAPVIAAPAGEGREPVVLFVGSLFNRRRLPDLVAAFAIAATRVPDARLVLVGDNRTSPRLDPLALAGAHGVADRVEWHEYVTDAELSALYSRAAVFAFLSEYEGFAMTPFEALAHGVPPVLLDTPVAREVYGDGAVLVAADPLAAADALTRLLTDPAAHQQQVEAGRARMARYSWATTASTVRLALEDAAASR